MSRKIQFQRRRAFLKQSGRCYYCCVPMWTSDPRRFASEHGLAESEVRRFKCTAEHLKPRSDGGPHTRRNIVAACWFCNRTRHRIASAPEPTEYLRHVRKRLAKRRWHPVRYRHLFAEEALGG